MIFACPSLVIAIDGRLCQHSLIVRDSGRCLLSSNRLAKCTSFPGRLPVFNTSTHFWDSFSPSHLSASTLRSVLARIMACHCPRSSAISVVIWFLAISSFTRSRHLRFGLPHLCFPCTIICNICLMASSLSLL